MIRPVCSAIGTNSARADDAELRVIPARERLGADDPARAQVGLRLVVELDLALVDRRAQAAGEREAARRVAVELGLEDARGRGRTAWPSTSRCRRAAGASRCPRRASGTARGRSRRRSPAACPRARTARAGARAGSGRPSVASSGLSTRGSRTPNSSPPRRATVSESRSARFNRRATSCEQQVAHVVAERVVDLLEVVEIHDHHDRVLAVAAASADGLIDAVAEQLAVRQAGERVVQRLVLLRDRLAAAAVDGEDRQEEQRDRRQREVGGEHDDRRQAEHQAVDRGLEEQVAHHVAEDRSRADASATTVDDQRDVDEEERGRGEQDAGQVDRGQVRLASRAGDRS